VSHPLFDTHVVLTRFGRRFSNGQVILALGCFGEGQASLTLEVGG